MIVSLLLPGLPDLGTSNLPTSLLLIYLPPIPGYGLGNERTKPVRYLFNEAASEYRSMSKTRVINTDLVSSASLCTPAETFILLMFSCLAEFDNY